MGLFKKKSRADSEHAANLPENTPDTASGGKSEKRGKKEKKKRKKSELKRLFRESVFETVRGDFQNNTYFKTDDVCYGLALTEDLIAQASTSDGTRGSFVTYVNNGNIRVYVSSETLDYGYILLIPDATTIENLQEFLFIKNASFEFVAVDLEGKVTPTGCGFTFDQIAQYAAGPDENGRNPIPALKIGDSVITNGAVKMNQQGIYTQADPDAEEVMGEEPAIADEVPADVPEIEPEGVVSADSESEEAWTEEEISGDFPAEDSLDLPKPDDAAISLSADISDDFPEDMAPDEALPMDYDPAYDDEEYEMSDDDIEGGTVEDMPDTFFEEMGSPEQLAKSVERIFYPNDLDMVVSMDAFEAQFGNAMEGFVPFSEERTSDGYLDQYLNELSANANTLLLQNRQENIRILREKYMSLMNAVCTDIAEKVSLDATTNIHGANYKGVHDARQQQESEMEDLLAKRYAEINEAWQKQIEEEKAAAAMQAAREYIQRHGRQHDEDLRNAKQELKIEIESAFTDGIRQIMDARRREAARRLEYGVHTTLSVVSAEYRKMLTEEGKLYNDYDRKMREYIESHRAEEHARTKALQEQLDQKSEASKVRDEFISKLDAAEAQYQKNVDFYEAQIVRMDDEAKARMAELKEHYEDQLDRGAKIEADLRNSLTHQNDHILEMEKRKDEEYQHQIKVLKDALAATDETHEREVSELRQKMKHTGKVTTAIIIGVSILMLAAGAIGGAYYNMRTTQQELKDAREAVERTISENEKAEEQKSDEAQQKLDAGQKAAEDVLQTNENQQN